MDNYTLKCMHSELRKIMVTREGFVEEVELCRMYGYCLLPQLEWILHEGRDFPVRNYKPE